MHTTTSTTRFKTVFIYGLGRSGSTLLGRLLDNHPDIVSVGELLRLDEVVDDPSAKCSCGQLASVCPEWNRLIEGIPEKVRRNYKKWTPELLSRVRENAAAKVLVDVSKTRAYRLSKRWKNPDVGHIILLRDPRGIFRSFVADNADLKDRLKLHKKWLGRFMDFARKHHQRSIVVHYEDLVTRPEETMARICGFIGIEFRQELLEAESKIHHLATYSGSSYMKGTGALRLDERWRHEMKPEHIAKITDYLKVIPVYRDRYKLHEAV